MKKIFSIVLIAGCMLMHYSCSEDFLVQEPPATLAGSAITNESGVESILTGAYAMMVRGGIFGGAMGTDWTYASGASDDMYKGSEAGDQTQFNELERYSAMPNNSYMAERWRDCYNGVARCNSTLEFLKTVQAGSKPIPADRAKQIEAEVKYLRAWFHFSANRVFKNIPYIMTPDEMGGKLPEEIPNSDPGWTGIESDLDFAIANLPESFPGYPGRATKYAALTLKAQAFMYQNKLSAAKPLLDQVLAGPFKLVDNYFDNYDERTENNAESIFELQCATSATGYTSMQLAGAIMISAGGPAAIGWGFYQPSQCLVEAFTVDNNGLPYLDINTRPAVRHDMGIGEDDPFTPTDQLLDLRLDWTVARRGVDFLDWGIFPGRAWVRLQTNGGPYMSKKYMHFASSQANQNGSGFQNNRNFRYHRLAHVILWRAEIAAEEGDLTLAAELVNQVRARARDSKQVMGLCTATTLSFTGVVDPSEIDWTKPAANYKVGLYPVPFSSQQYARDAVRMEIRLEFASEGQRFFDLRRWGIDVEVLNDYIARDSNFRNYMKGASYSTKRRYWPVPQAQLDIQRGVLTQDPDYL